MLLSRLSSPTMARIITRAIPFTFTPSSSSLTKTSLSANLLVISSSTSSSIFNRKFHISCKDDKQTQRSSSSSSSTSGKPFGGAIYNSQRGIRNSRLRKAKKKELELAVRICIEEELPDDPEIMSIAEVLRLNVPTAMKLAFDGLKGSTYKTRDTAIEDVGGFESVELSLLICNDDFIRKLNKDWRDEDHATDVLSMSQHIPGLELPITVNTCLLLSQLMLGDVVISVETAARQAEERGHTLIDEIRILMIHGLLHLLGFDHEISEEAETEMESEEEHLLRSLGWKGKGLIQCAIDAADNGSSKPQNSDGEISETSKTRKKEGSLRFYNPKFSYIFCDMDGTLLNSKSQISATTAAALREAMSRGVKVVIATGKARPAVVTALRAVDLAGKDGVVSEFSPGVFLQGLLVYGTQGREICKINLDPNICREAFMYSLEHKVALVAFSQDRCLTLFEHPLIDSLHTIFHEPKAEVMSSVEHLLAAAEVQKLLFFDTAEEVAATLRPYWTEVTKGRAGVVQAMPDMLEIIPAGTSKGSGVKMLLEHFGATANEIMAIGDGENDIEMLELAALGVALSNGAEKTKAVANVIGLSNDEDGVADAIYRYAF
ncbi:hypothetical protein GIB67_019577 [Kingdonia uniflora]|uniref:Haloacid dehalogenase-like hydrolase family protein n=1 Tax=Kingdonia uniflora TaxID=39325 RepID=A0A7J7N0K1_9MAGN|nr:hypothetical protein GIB67_019577 [Kingdonia uniflora]